MPHPIRDQESSVCLDLRSYAVELGALVEVPGYESHKRGTNWMASVRPDPRSPGGLARDFWERGRGRYYYMVPAGLTPGDVLECGHDYTTGGGNRHRSREYGVVIEVTPERLILALFPRAIEAFALSREDREHQKVEEDGHAG
jgi:hypothetical protein